MNNAEGSINLDSTYFWKHLMMKKGSDRGILCTMDSNDSKAERVKDV